MKRSKGTHQKMYTQIVGANNYSQANSIIFPHQITFMYRQLYPLKSRNLLLSNNTEEIKPCATPVTSQINIHSISHNILSTKLTVWRAQSTQHQYVIDTERCYIYNSKRSHLVLTFHLDSLYAPISAADDNLPAIMKG